MDGRWPKTVEEPAARIKETLETRRKAQAKAEGQCVATHIENPKDDQKPLEDPFFVHLVYLTTGLRWWTNALHSIDNQLITYVRHFDPGLI
jgi:hypothetical protein